MAKGKEKQYTSFGQPTSRLKIKQWQRIQINVMDVQRNPMNPQWQRAESSQSKCHEDRIAGKGIHFDDTLQFGAQVHPNTNSNEDSRCKSCRGEGVEEARDESNMELGQSQEQKGRYSGSTQRQRESPLCNIYGHMSL